MDGFASAVRILPLRVRPAAERLSTEERRAVTEFRLRTGTLPTAVTACGERELPGAVRSDPGELAELIDRATDSSPYAVGEMLRQGFVTAPGGIRIGVCGEGNYSEDRLRTLRSVSSVCIRVPHEVRGCSAGLFHMDSPSTLILSPPGGGKTTLLRDAVRLLSVMGERVGVCDERGELAAMNQGRSGFDLGGRTDVLTGVRKSDAAIMLLRTMSPDFIAMDEITAEEDTAACVLAAHCGVRLIATAHASSADELRRRKVYLPLLSDRVFERCIVIGRSGAERSYREVCL